MNFEIFAIKYAESTLPSKDVFYTSHDKERLPISFVVYLIKTDKSYILVDAGCVTMPGWDMKYFCSPVEIIERMGIDATDINHVVITHAHHDHIEAVNLFQSATVHIQGSEYENGKKYITVQKVELFEDECIIDECVRVIKWGGHTPGSSVVLVGDYIICGDECYTKACLEQKIPTGVTCNIQKSTDFVEEFSKEKYKPLLCHDPGILPGKNGFMKI